MDLTVPLATLTPTMDAAVLSVLARTTAPLTGRRVAALAGRSHTGVQGCLSRLVHHGLVHAEAAGAALLYTLNREHLLAEPLLRIAGAREELLTRLRDTIAGWPVAPEHASVFGSFARGQAGPDSDIDVLILRPVELDPDDERWQQQLGELEHQVYAWTGNSLAWFETTRQTLADAVATGDPLVDSWREDAVHLAGPTLAALLRQVSA